VDREYIHLSHNPELFWDVPDPHNPVWQCRFCRLVTCSVCPPGEGMDDEELAAACAKAPPGWKPPPRQIPLKIVRDEIAAPPGTTQIQSGVVQLPGGNTFQISSGTITVTFAASGLVLNATQVEEIVRRLDEPVLKGRSAQVDFGNAIRMGVLEPAKPAREDKTGSLADRAGQQHPLVTGSLSFAGRASRSSRTSGPRSPAGPCPRLADVPGHDEATT
jgi:hypothetical protein